MKFQWRMQRILDLKRMEENSLKSDLAALTEKILSLKSQIMLINMKTSSMISSLSDVALNERLQKQSIAIEYSVQSQKEIKSIEKKIEIIKAEQEKVKEKILEARKYRKGLEKLKEKAQEEFVREYEKRIQNEIDEITSIANARRIMETSACA